MIPPMMQPEANVNILHTHGLTQLRPCTKTVTEKTTCHHSPFKQLRCPEDGTYKRGTCTDSGIRQPYNHTGERQVWPNSISVIADLFIRAQSEATQVLKLLVQFLVSFWAMSVPLLMERAKRVGIWLSQKKKSNYISPRLMKKPHLM